MKNNEKGITLVALVITIIVLLILAAVTIMALSGDNGILTRAKQSKVNTNVANAKDVFNTVAQEAITEYYNAKYVTSGSTEASVGAQIAAAIRKNSMTTPYLAEGESSKTTLTIQTNVKDSTGATLTCTITADGAISWTGDSLEK